MTGIDWDAPPPEGYVRNRHGDLIRRENVAPADLRQDALVEHILSFALPLSHQLARFRMRVLEEVDRHRTEILDEYGVRRGGRAGNIQLISLDGRRRVLVAQADTIAVGPEIEAAHQLILECLDEWCGATEAPLRALVEAAFTPDATGRYSVSQILRLRRVHIDDPRWREAQRAIADALRPAGRVEYVRVQLRDDPRHPWREVPLRISAAEAPPAEADSPAVVLERRIRSAIAAARDDGLREGQITEAFRAAKRRGDTPAAEGSK